MHRAYAFRHKYVKGFNIEIMKKYASKLGLFSTSLALVTLLGATVSALPSMANSHAQTVASSQKAVIARQRMCLTRERVITQIMTRIETRANNQDTLFSGIATRVEAFYTKKGHTLANYQTLVNSVNVAEAKVQTDFVTLKTSSSFSCTVSEPKAIVTGFQGYLTTEISDLQSLRTAVKNLIVGVAQANGMKLNNSSTTSTGSGQ